MKALFVLFAFVFAGLVSFEAQAQTPSRVATVISGKLARAGSSNRKAYDDKALKSLCEQGYTLAIYVYPGAKNRTVSCSRGSIEYVGMKGWTNPTAIVSRIESEARAGGKTVVHCWYGVHASNFVTAYALNKMCGFSGSEAASYFRSHVPRGSLAQSRIDDMAAKLERLSSSGGGYSGCPN